MTGLHAALAELAAEWADRTPRSDAPRDRRECAAVLHALLASHVPSGQVDHEQAYRDLRAGVEALVLAAWDDGNATGLDGWIGPERGEEPDPEGIRARERFADHAAALLTSSVPATASGGATEGSFGNPIRVPVADFVQRAIRDHPATGVASSDGSSKPGSSLEDAGSTDGDREGLSDEEIDTLLCRCDSEVCPVHNENSDGYVEHRVGDLIDAINCILAARLAEVTAERDRLIAAHQKAVRKGTQSAEHMLAAVERAERAEAERDGLAAEVNSLTADWDQEHARAEALAEQVAAIEDLGDRWTEGRVRAPYIGSVGVAIRAVLTAPGTALAARDTKVAAQARHVVHVTTEPVAEDAVWCDECEEWVTSGAPERAAGGEVKPATVEWGTAHADDLPSVTPAQSEKQARAQVDGWNSAPHSDGKGLVMRRTVGPWEPLDGGEVEQP